MRSAESWHGTASPIGRDGRRWEVTGRRDLARSVLEAKRHSRAVRFLRVAIPVGAVVAILAVTLASWLSPLQILAKLPNASGKLLVSGSKIMMEAPRLSGYTRDGRAYEVTAKTAAQDITKPDILELTDIRGKMDQEDKTALDLTAVSGLYDRKTELLALDQHVVLNSSSGYQVRLSEATIDVRKSHVVSNKPVEVSLKDGFLTANRLEVIDNGDTIVFDGNVSMLINNAQAAGTDSPAR